ncbi:SWI SNF, matrix associated, actin dependent regulator of chromatin, sub a, member [Puccinia graminis f. sp. tritici]|uniref:SWI SNF, matrix associated, actin dependent regulator of chromatin, sub a, member n=1 Tax=Puccinia graminis f. sp. tritici TaxID=56615 RepID=A0A5B0P385_PUCGR|nr:SWI SNF, matrix associated, actin dependent regulator of chromatin, sub a, member [Puccinia graminis f. sp. tritici]
MAVPWIELLEGPDEAIPPMISIIVGPPPRPRPLPPPIASSQPPLPSVNGFSSALPDLLRPSSLSFFVEPPTGKAKENDSSYDRLEKLPPLNEQYAIDDLLTKHFGFAPKVFTGHIFNIINEAIYDTVLEVEKAVIESYFPGSAENRTEGLPSSTRTVYPSKDDITKSLNQLETLLCSSIDNQFDLLEIWLHRKNVLDRKLAGLKAVSCQLTKISSEARTIYDPETNKPVDLIGQSTMILGDYERLMKLDKVRETRERATNFAKSAPQHATQPMTADEMIEDEQDPCCRSASANPFQTHARAINLLSKAKVDDFLGELADKGALDVDRDASKFGKSVIKFHVEAEKEEQQRIERLSKERLKALKADDEEAYLKLIDTAKDTQITHLLRQTDQYLENLSHAVLQQQNDAVHRDGQIHVEQDQTGATIDESAFGAAPVFDDNRAAANQAATAEGGKADYYNVAHRIKEEVTKQSSMLTGGQLKEYQIKGLQWMVSLYNKQLNGILADEMGLGKTIQTISLITWLMENKKQPGPYLVIVPLSTLPNWTLEFEKWAPTVKVVVYKGSPNVRKCQPTYEYIIKDCPMLCKIKWVHMIIDDTIKALTDSDDALPIALSLDSHWYTAPEQSV